MASHTEEIIELTTKFDELVHELDRELKGLRPDCDVSEAARERNSFAMHQWGVRGKVRVLAMQLLLITRGLRGMLQPPGATGDPMEVILMRAETRAANALRLVEFKYLDDDHELFDLPEPERTIVTAALYAYLAQTPGSGITTKEDRERAQNWLTYLINKRSLRWEQTNSSAGQ